MVFHMLAHNKHMIKAEKFLIKIKPYNVNLQGPEYSGQPRAVKYYSEVPSTSLNRKDKKVVNT